MGKIKWSRVILCGVLTGVVYTVLSAISTWSGKWAGLTIELNSPYEWLIVTALS